MKPVPVKSEYFPMQGGLDLTTPAISINPGLVFDAQNYEPEISGGYRRIDGYERYDGQPSPSAASYWWMAASVVGVVVGNTVTGGTSGATGKVLAVGTGFLVLGRVTGIFVATESLLVAAVPVGTATASANANGEATPVLDADYALLAANDVRADIQPVPGSGPIRGVHVYNDVLYAFRDNVGGTAGLMYKATAGGWALVAFGTEIQFTAGVSAIVAGNTITGGTSGATATVIKVMIRTGSWGFAAVGTLIITPIAGVFVSGEALKVAAVTCATAASAATAIARAPGGRVVFVNANFTGSTSTRKMYGADGVNKAFEFDGTNYIPIRTGMATDTPKHVMFYKAYLFLSFLGSAQLSSIGDPYSWTAVLGAAELTTGEEITGFLPQAATSVGSSMAIFTTGKTYILYGSSTADFKLLPSVYDLGYSPYTVQPVSNNSYGLTSRGIQSLLTTLNYGDFQYASVSHLVQPLITAKRGLEIASTSSKTKNQYRLYFSDGTGLVVGLTGDKISGLLPLNYSKPVRCIETATLSNGDEAAYFGSDDGYVYRDSVGTSFDGAPIEAWIRPAFNHSKSPQVRKRYRRAIFEVRADGYSQVDVGFDLGYGTPDVLPPRTTTSNQILSGGYWDQFTWDRFTWDAQLVSAVNVSLDGTEKNISFLFYSNRAQDRSHTVQGITLVYSPRRLDR